MESGSPKGVTYPSQPSFVIPSSFNGEHKWRTKGYISKVLPSIDRRYNLAAGRRNTRLKGISEELDSGTTTMIDDNRSQSYGATATFDFSEDGYDEFLLDEELARDGLYRGNYRNLVLLYTIVPLTTLISFICLALVGFSTPSLFPYPPYLPFPILEVLTATALWSLSYLLRDFLYATASSLSSITIITTTLSATLQTTSNLLLRQIAIPILLIPYYSSKHLSLTWQDDAFRRVWWVALGWAAAEAVVGVKQGYESIALYKDVLVTVNTSNLNSELGTRGAYRQDAIDVFNAPETPRRQLEEDLDATPKQMIWANPRGSPIQRTVSPRSLSTGSNHIPTQEDPPPISNERQPLLRVLIQTRNDQSKRLQAENEVERDLDQLMTLKNREELEEVYGIPFIRIPVFISCLHRINSILSSLGTCLLLTAAYMQSTFAIAIPSSPLPTPSSLHQTPSNRLVALTTPPIIVVYTLLSIVHTPLILPRIGIHTFVYIELLISLGVFFGGLAMWDVLS